MGLVGIKSFDRIATDDLAMYNNGETSWLSIESANPRFPGKTHLFSQAAGIGAKFTFAETDDLIAGGALRLTSLGIRPEIRIFNGGSDMGYIGGLADGSLRYVRNFVTHETSVAGILKAATWQFLEVRFYTHASSGVVEARLDGKTVLLFEGDTYENIAAATVVKFGCYGGYVCDVYVLDLNTAGRNDFLGPIVVDRILPDADGTHEDWTPSEGSDNYAMVDDDGDIDDDTTYVETDVDEDKDSYSLEDYTEVGDILGIKLEATARKTDAGVASLRVFSRLSGSEYDGDEEALPEGYAQISKIWEKNPDTAADWTETVIDNGEFGIAAMFTTTTTV